MKRLTLIISMLIALVGLNANAAMYIVGSDPFGNWNPGNGVEMTDNGDGTYSYTVAINGTVYFVFGDGLNSDWGIFNANYRYGPATGDTGISAGKTTVPTSSLAAVTTIRSPLTRSTPSLKSKAMLSRSTP